MRSPRNLRAQRAFAAALALSLVVAACSDEADEDPLGGATSTSADGDGVDDGGNTAAASVPDGWKVVEGDGVSIAVPEEWIDVPLEDFELGREDLEELMPQADEAMLNQAVGVVQQGGVLLAFGPPDAGFTDNLNILRLPVSAELDQLEREAELGMEALGAEVHSLDRVELPSGEAIRVSYTAEFQSPDGPFSVEGVQLYLPSDGATFVLTVSAVSDPGELADQMAETFEVT
ncbi:MAG: hypothetical protein ACLGI8_04155 [Acidimicrobiia bacterium]